ncbi:MAG: hypothetical protein M0Z49_00150 [Chloroflexi bacterium]|nr:hypothetical protein [Chloroflexota bacterium]
MRLNRFLSLTAAVGGLLGVGLALVAAVALRLVGLMGDVPVLGAGLVAGLGIGLLGGVWVEQAEEMRRRDRNRSRRARGVQPGDDRDPDEERRTRLFGPLAFGLTFLTVGTVAGLSAAQQLAGSSWAPLAGLAWLTLAIAGGAGGVVAGAVWQVVIERILEITPPS